MESRHAHFGPIAAQRQTHSSIFFYKMLGLRPHKLHFPDSFASWLILDSVNRGDWKAERVEKGLYSVCCSCLCCYSSGNSSQQQQLVLDTNNFQHVQKSTSEMLAASRCACSSKVWDPILQGPWSQILGYVNSFPLASGVASAFCNCFVWVISMLWFCQSSSIYVVNSQC